MKRLSMSPSAKAPKTTTAVKPRTAPMTKASSFSTPTKTDKKVSVKGDYSTSTTKSNVPKNPAPLSDKLEPPTSRASRNASQFNSHVGKTKVANNKVPTKDAGRWAGGPKVKAGTGFAMVSGKTSQGRSC